MVAYRLMLRVSIHVTASLELHQSPHKMTHQVKFSGGFHATISSRIRTKMNQFRSFGTRAAQSTNERTKSEHGSSLVKNEKQNSKSVRRSRGLAVKTTGVRILRSSLHCLQLSSKRNKHSHYIISEYIHKRSSPGSHIRI